MEYPNAEIELINIDLIKVGDTVFHDGFVRTICKKVLHINTFMGTTIFGDSYKCGSVLVKKVNFKIIN